MGTLIEACPPLLPCSVFLSSMRSTTSHSLRSLYQVFHQFTEKQFSSSVSKFQLPDLPYDYGELEPFISAEIMKLHHQKHHGTYVNNLNLALEKIHKAEEAGNVGDMIALQKMLKFNGGGHVNHSILWHNLAPVNKGGGTRPDGAFLKAVQQEFGSLDALISSLSATAIGVEGSGWGWLGLDPNSKKLKLEWCQNQDPLSTRNLIPLLGVDVWEHSYYLQYKNDRATYVKNIWNVVNWKDVANRYEKAMA